MNYDFSCLEVYDSFGFPQASYNSQYEHCTELVSTTASFLYQCHSVHGSMSDHGTPSSIASPLTTTPVFFDAFLFQYETPDILPQDWPSAISYPNPPHPQIRHIPTWQPMSNHGLPAPTLSRRSLHIGGDMYPCPNGASWPTTNEYPPNATTGHGYNLPNGDYEGVQRTKRSRKRQAPYRVDDQEGATNKKNMSQKTFSSETLGCENDAPKSITRRNNKRAHQPPAADQQAVGCVGSSPVPPPPPQTILMPPLATLDPPTAESNPMRAARSIIRGHAHKKDKEITFVNECNLEWWEPYTTPKKSVE